MSPAGIMQDWIIGCRVENRGREITDLNAVTNHEGLSFFHFSADDYFHLSAQRSSNRLNEHLLLYFWCSFIYNIVFIDYLILYSRGGAKQLLFTWDLPLKSQVKSQVRTCKSQVKTDKSYQLRVSTPKQLMFSLPNLVSG